MRTVRTDENTFTLTGKVSAEPVVNMNEIGYVTVELSIMSRGDDIESNAQRIDCLPAVILGWSMSDVERRLPNNGDRVRVTGKAQRRLYVEDGNRKSRVTLVVTGLDILETGKQRSEL